MNEFDNVIIGMNKEEIYTLILKIEKLKSGIQLMKELKWQEETDTNSTPNQEFINELKQSVKDSEKAIKELNNAVENVFENFKNETIAKAANEARSTINKEFTQIMKEAKQYEQSNWLFKNAYQRGNK